jgi:hypothetical protein
VRRYRVLRAIDNPNYVMLDLEFDGSSEAEAFLAVMRELWHRIEGRIIQSPRAWIVEALESNEYSLQPTPQLAYERLHAQIYQSSSYRLWRASLALTF